MPKQAQLGVPHSRIQVELGFILQAGTCQILNFNQNPRQSQSVQCTELNWRGGHRTDKCIPGGGTPHIFSEQKLMGGAPPHILSEQGANRVGTLHRKSVYREGGHRTYFLNTVPIWGDTTYTF